METQPYYPPEIVSREQQIQQLLTEVTGYFGVPVESLREQSRVARLTDARHVAMYLLREKEDLTWVEIGRRFGRNHSTAFCGARKVERLLKHNPKFSEEIRPLVERVRSMIPAEQH